MYYCLHFYCCGTKVASALNVTVISQTELKLLHFICCNTGRGVQHVNNHDKNLKTLCQ